MALAAAASEVVGGAAAVVEAGTKVLGIEKVGSLQQMVAVAAPYLAAETRRSRILTVGRTLAG